MTEIVLHIGSFKTGTTYIQSCLHKSSESLSVAGILTPTWREQATAARDLIARDAATGRTHPDQWDALASRLLGWDGDRVVVSMEYLSLLGQRKISMVLDSLADRPVRVVLTARDLLGLLPGQWQTSLRGAGQTWTFEQYVDGATRKRPRRTAAGRHFWRRHNWPAILKRWARLVGPDQVCLVTVPPAGSPPDELWTRFCRAARIEPVGPAVTSRRKESLGSASAELVRRVNVELAQTPAPAPVARVQRRWVKSVLSAQVLRTHTGQERALVPPSSVIPWAERRSARLVARIEALGVPIIGDVTDLAPHPRENARYAPPQEQDVLDAATYAVDTLQVAAAVVPAGAGSAARLEAAVGALASAARAAASQTPS
jgi:hypothetical protein